MHKRGQVTIFIAIGLLIIVLAGIFILATQPKKPVSALNQASLEQSGLDVQQYVKTCLQQKLSEAKEFGLKEQLRQVQEAYIQEQLRQCSDFSEFEKQGLTVKAGEPKAEVILTGQVLMVSVNYPITVRKGDAEISMGKFNEYIKRDSTLQLRQDTTLTSSRRTLTTDDGRAQITIPQTALITKDGQQIDGLSMRIIDKNFNSLDNPVVYTGVAYEGLPEGAKFEPGIELTIKYDPGKLPGVPEESLAIAYYDEEKGIWTVLDSRVDTSSKTVTATITHFTKFAIVYGCTGTDNEQAIDLGFLYKAPCYAEGAGAGAECPQWIIRKSPASSEFIRKPEDVGKGAAQGQGPDSGPIYAPPGQEVKIYSEFKDLSIGECRNSWDASKDGIPAGTYGYRQVKDAGSKKSAAQIEFSLMPNGGSCASKASVIVKCDDECTDFKLNTEEAKPDQIKKEGNTYNITFTASALKANDKNTLSFTVKNLYEACSSAEAMLTLSGKGMFEKCPESSGEEDYLIQGCACGSKNANIIYDADKVAKNSKFKEIAAKKQKELTSEEKSILKEAVAKGKEQYCINNNIVSKERLQQEKSRISGYLQTFKELAKDEQLTGCCSKEAELYPDLSTEKGKEGCEIVVCKKKESYFWAYTGWEFKDGKRQAKNEQKCKGTGGSKPTFLAMGCGITSGATGGGASPGTPTTPTTPSQPGQQPPAQPGKQPPGTGQPGTGTQTGTIDLDNCNANNVGKAACKDSNTLEYCLETTPDPSQPAAYSKISAICSNGCDTTTGKCKTPDDCKTREDTSKSPRCSSRDTNYAEVCLSSEIWGYNWLAVKCANGCDTTTGKCKQTVTTPPQQPPAQPPQPSQPNPGTCPAGYSFNGAWGRPTSKATEASSKYCNGDKLYFYNADSTRTDQTGNLLGSACEKKCDNGCEATSAATNEGKCRENPVTRPSGPEGYELMSGISESCGATRASYLYICGGDQNSNFQAVKNSQSANSFACKDGKWFKKDCATLGGCVEETGRCLVSEPECPVTYAVKYAAAPEMNQECQNVNFWKSEDYVSCKDGVSLYCDKRGNACISKPGKEQCQCTADNKCLAETQFNCKRFGESCNLGEVCCGDETLNYCYRPLKISPSGTCTTKDTSLVKCSRESQACGPEFPQCCDEDNFVCTRDRPWEPANTAGHCKKRTSQGQRCSYLLGDADCFKDLTCSGFPTPTCIKSK
ncbi:hypothetical protein HYY72_00065 [Candidatus Woesearchaeota archaeon]|nr:hypothetical protein [Candidatus Woesearchaeota archaeon]